MKQDPSSIKSVKSIFQIEKLIQILKLKPVYTHLPPLLNVFFYNALADVWGVRNIFTKRFPQCEKLEIGDCFRILRCERIHLKFFKYILVVHWKV